MALDGIATGRFEEYSPDPYEALEFNGRRLPDLLIAGGTLAVPGLPPMSADLLVNYDLPLLQREGAITDIGDMGETEAQDTLRIDGLFLIPDPSALDAEGAIDVGAPAHFVIAEDVRGNRVRFRFQGGPPRDRPPRPRRDDRRWPRPVHHWVPLDPRPQPRP